jgi:uncharacterized membrane protein
LLQQILNLGFSGVFANATIALRILSVCLYQWHQLSPLSIVETSKGLLMFIYGTVYFEWFRHAQYEL